MVMLVTDLIISEINHLYTLTNCTILDWSKLALSQMTNFTIIPNFQSLQTAIMNSMKMVGSFLKG